MRTIRRSGSLQWKEASLAAASSYQAYQRRYPLPSKQPKMGEVIDF